MGSGRTPLRRAVFFLQAWVCAAVFAAAGCGGSGGGGGEPASLVTISLGAGQDSAGRAAQPREARAVAVSIRSVAFRISGPGMAEIRRTIATTGPSSQVSETFAVPRGPSRTFSVEALDGGGVLRYEGSATVDVSGERLTLPIQMKIAATNTALRRWRWLNPTPSGADLLAVVYGAGTFVAAGEAGTILSSSDGGATWEARFADTSAWLRGAAYGDGVFVVVGDQGTILASDDLGVTWSASAPVEESLGAVAFGNGRFLAVGDSGRVLTSTDGARSWTPTNDVPSTASFTGIAFGNGSFYALEAVITANGASTVVAVSSDDGATWSPVGVTVGFDSTGMAFGGGGLFVADVAGRVAILPEGGEPTFVFPTRVQTPLHGVAFEPGLLAVVGDGGLVTVSTDGGAVWAPSALEVTTAFRACALGDGTLVAVGDQGMVATSTTVRWSSALAGDVAPLGFGGGAVVAQAGSGGILSSADGGATWNEWSPGVSVLAGPLSAFAYGGGSFVAVGPFSSKSLLTDLVVPPTPTLYVSSDGGASWSDRSEGVTEDLSAVAYGAGTYVAVSGGGTAYRSADGGATWSRVLVAEGASLEGVAHGAGAFVAVGTGANEAGAVFTSPDGTAWSSVAAPPDDFLRQIAYADGAFVAVGGGARTFVSSDGRTWVEGARVPLSDALLSGIAYGGGAVVAVDTLGEIHTSTDNGASWTTAPFRSPQPLRSVTFGDGSFLAGGAGGTVLRSDPL